MNIKPTTSSPYDWLDILLREFQKLPRDWSISTFRIPVFYTTDMYLSGIVPVLEKFGPVEIDLDQADYVLGMNLLAFMFQEKPYLKSWTETRIFKIALTDEAQAKKKKFYSAEETKVSY